MSVDRRRFLKSGTLLAGSLIFPIATQVGAAIYSQSTEPPPDTEGALNDWIWIGNDGRIIIGVSQCEVGQGIYTGLSEVIADEMDADWKQVVVRFVTGKNAYRQVAGGESLAQFVAASTSMTVFYERVRLAGAQARDFFKRAAALQWGISADRCETRDGYVFDGSSRKIAYGELLSYAARVPLNPSPPFKTSAEAANGMIGKYVHRVDTAEKVNGSAVFGIDVEVPGMLIGVPWMVPSFTGEIVRIRNEAMIRKLNGVVALVKTRHPSMLNMKGIDKNHAPNTIVVVAKTYWQAKKAADLLDVEYDAGARGDLSSAEIDAANRAMLDDGALVKVVDRGDADRLLVADRANASRFHEASYVAPYIAHASMEPCNATSHFQGDKIVTWGPFQGQDMVRVALSKVFGLQPQDVTVNTTFIGGSFGRKYLPDAVLHATFASKAVGRPVKVIYPREIDIRGDYLRPPCVARYRAVLDENGYPTAIHARYAGQSLFWQMHRDLVKKAGGWDESMVECVYDPVYAFPALHVEAGIVEQPPALSFLRGVGSISSVFFLESFLNELSDKAGRDALEYRRELLRDNPDALRVLNEAARTAGWNTPLSPGHYRGIAFNRWVGRNHAFTTYVALVMEVRVARGRIRVVRATCAIDCGKVINPNLVAANVEGGIGFALTGALYSALHFSNGGIVEGNFNTYPLIGIADMPKIETVILPSERPPQGCGEVSTAVVAPALADALYHATGHRFQSMPFRLDRIEASWNGIDGHPGECVMTTCP
ncbi:xanthine dehydrogenase family protein molybdopterin-binding subunit [Burkholderia cenocepacia]|uniref:xanthine dehydrogenase family protein molybdopterin-binding subunit n=1 Tax=Burkholderia cepacia complex TaxID=87882 RepID=UPI000F577E06|nr:MULTISPECIES: molybdopterin cofactor-binding domain-containing protein [Burkholderia cepacia complex]ELW9447601.1 xanthine dehydrogenase family protein molybdopterin-binding subunit [Burkholderia cenocepacia]MBR8484257.1 xanthine dehydrogenase family protein molybdopterin-binding subunit [Burkholderia cenocepacia]MDN7468398.1 molybdopterin-dependent oxidoreductase [Burkholderia orbicola]MDN7501527.1 molybdopterin-dependent oxidoreductase [Burkholderia orbicola]RQU19149.1 xanthine dehydrogen